MDASPVDQTLMIELSEAIIKRREIDTAWAVSIGVHGSGNG